MRRTHPLLALLLLLAGLTATAQQPPKPAARRLNVGVSLPWSRPDTSTVAFNLGLLSNLGSLHGCSLNALSGVVAGDVRGLQVAGLLSVAGRSQAGLQVAGLINDAGRSGSGAQVAALVNAARTYRGVQLSLLSNVSVRQSGLQLSAVNNLCCERLHGLQLTGVANVAVGVDGGSQIAALVNVTQGTHRGLQFAAANYAGSLSGLQLGGVNVTGSLKGWQIGLVNHTEHPSKHKIGLVNTDSLTRLQYFVFGGNTAKFGGGVRFLNRLFYTQVGVGTQWLGLDEKFSGCLFYRRGALIPLTSRLSLPLDIGYAHIETFVDDRPDHPERLYGLQARAGLEWAVTPRLRLQAMTGYGLTRPYGHDYTYERKALFEVCLYFEGR